MYYAIETKNNEVIMENDNREALIVNAESYYHDKAYDNAEYGLGEEDVYLVTYTDDGELVSSKIITLTWNAINEPSEFQQHNVWGL